MGSTQDIDYPAADQVGRDRKNTCWQQKILSSLRPLPVRIAIEPFAAVISCESAAGALCVHWNFKMQAYENREQKSNMAEWGWDYPVLSLCRSLCLRPRRRLLCIWAALIAPLVIRFGSVSRFSSRLYHPCWCSSHWSLFTETWAETDL